MSSVKKRTRARELALQFLYQVDLLGPSVLPDLRAFLREMETDAESVQYAQRIVEGVHAQRAEVDRVIAEVAQNWKIHRMAVIDRNILRIGAWELLFVPDVPPKVSINEGIELGKRFSTANTGAFVNGILDKVRQIAHDRAGAAEGAE
jgi:transcription antitermination factor NusB